MDYSQDCIMNPMNGPISLSDPYYTIRKHVYRSTWTPKFITDWPNFWKFEFVNELVWAKHWHLVKTVGVSDTNFLSATQAIWNVRTCLVWNNLLNEICLSQWWIYEWQTPSWNKTFSGNLDYVHFCVNIRNSFMIILIGIWNFKTISEINLRSFMLAICKCMSV